MNSTGRSEMPTYGLRQPAARELEQEVSALCSVIVAAAAAIASALWALYICN